MFKKLRNRLLMLNMGITSLVMLAAFVAVYFTTYNNIQRSNQEKLEQMTGVQIHTYPVGTLQGGAIQIGEETSVVANFISPDYSLSFSVDVDEAGNVQRVDSVIDMEQEAYEQAAAAAWELQSSTKQTLEFAQRQWLFAINPVADYTIAPDGIELFSGDGFRISFLDITESQNTLQQLLMTFFLVALLVLAAIFVVSLLFANRTIGPLKRAWGQQRQFIADASHELKTPLSVITANYDALLANRQATIESQMKWLDYMKNGTDRMSKLIGDLLSLAQMEGVDPALTEKAPFSLSRAIEEEMAAMAAAGREKGISMGSAVAPDVVAVSNEEMVRRVFAILLDNGVKYTQESGSMEVELRAGKRQGICRVKNTGPGIPQEALGKIFDRFYRADQARTGQKGGYGLGLPIAKAIMDRLGGEIWAESLEGGMTCFTFVVPL